MSATLSRHTTRHTIPDTKLYLNLITNNVIYKANNRKKFYTCFDFDSVICLLHIFIFCLCQCYFPTFNDKLLAQIQPYNYTLFNFLFIYASLQMMSKLQNNVISSSYISIRSMLLADERILI